MKPRDILLTALVNLAFGFHPIASKFGVDAVPPVLFAALRMAALALILSPWIRWHPGQMRQIATVGLLLGAVNFTLLFVGLSLTDEVATVSVVMQISIPAGALLGMIVYRERPGLQRLLGIAAGFGGIAIVCFDPRVVDYPLAMVCVAAGSLSGSVAMLQMRRMQAVPVFALQGWTALLSIAPMLAVSAVLESGQVAALAGFSGSAGLALAFTVFGTSMVGRGGMNYLIKRYPISIALPSQLPAPLITIAFGILLFGNRIDTVFVIGGIMTLTGVLLVMLPERRRAAL